MRRTRNQTRLVVAPLVGALVVGTHEGCPYETCKLFAEETRFQGIAMQTFAFEACSSSRESRSRT
jgi:hypothetical protein